MEEQNKGSPSKGNGTFRLLDLPAELQLRIFEYSVTEKEAIAITYSVWMKQHCPYVIEHFAQTGRKSTSFRAHHVIWQCAEGYDSCTQPALSRTCRAIRVDALKFYYQNNEFEAGICCCGEYEEFPTALGWLLNLGTTNLRHMRSLVVSDVFADEDLPIDLDFEGSCLRKAEAALVCRFKARLEPLEGGTPTEHRVIFPTSDEADK